MICPRPRWARNRPRELLLLTGTVNFHLGRCILQQQGRCPRVNPAVFKVNLAMLVPPIVRDMPCLQSYPNAAHIKNDNAGIPVRIQIDGGNADIIASIEKPAHEVDVVRILLEVAQIGAAIWLRQPFRCDDGRTRLRFVRAIHLRV